MSHEMFETLAAGYALDALDGDDLVRFREHLAEGCPTCEAMVRDSHEALAVLARQAPPVIPPASVKSALLARIAVGAATATPPARRSPPRWVPWAVGTAAAVVATAFVTGMLVAGRYETEIGRLSAETAALRERVQRDEAALREQLVASARVLDLLADPTTRVVTLRGGDPAARATGRVVWNDAGGGHLFVADLPPAPPGKTYELWTITGRTPRPAGLFDVDASGRAGRRLEAVPEGGPVDVFAVTLEPAGGVPAPTGPIVLASS
jgi:anti-sigma-K factor RskA